MSATGASTQESTYPGFQTSRIAARRPPVDPRPLRRPHNPALTWQKDRVAAKGPHQVLGLGQVGILLQLEESLVDVGEDLQAGGGQGGPWGE